MTDIQTIKISELPAADPGSTNNQVPINTNTGSGPVTGKQGTTGTGAFVLQDEPQITDPELSGPRVSGGMTIVSGTIYDVPTPVDPGDAANKQYVDNSTNVPTPTPTTLGGVFTYTSPANQWIFSLDNTGTFASSQPAAENLSNGVTGSGAVVLATGATTTNQSITNPAAITGVPSPTNAGDAANKGYVDALAAGLRPVASCAAATAAALPTNVYANGASGVGATLTASANGALTVDGHVVLLNERVLVKDEAAGSHNGIYTQTQVGTGGVPYILTRATDYDTSAEVTTGTFTFIANGSANAATQWSLVTTGTIIIGTTALVYTEIAIGSALYTAGTGLSLSGGNVFSMSVPVSIANGGWNATTIAGGRFNFALPVYVANRTALVALDVTKDFVVELREAKRQGTFMFDSSDLSAYVTSDPNQGIYVAPTSAPTGASGAWVRVGATGPILPEWWYETADTDDSAAMINRAIAFLEAQPTYIGGDIVLGRNIYILDASIVGTKNSISITGQGAGNVANTTPAYLAPTLVTVRQNTGAGIWLKGQNCTVADFRMNSDTTRAAAAFDITKPGIRIEALDVSSASTGVVSRTNIRRVRVDHQPGDGYLLNGPTNASVLDQCESWSNKGMGFRLDDGSRAGIVRANIGEPSLINIIECRALFNGGNALAISNPAATIQGVAVRIVVQQFDCSGNADDAAVRYSNHAVWMWAFDSTLDTCGFGGTNASLTPEIHGGLFIAGRDLRVLSPRFELCSQPVNVGQIAAGTTQGVYFKTFHVDQSGVTPAIAVVIAPGAVGVHMEFDVWGAFTEAMTDAEGCSQSYRGMVTEFSTNRTIVSGAVSVAENVAVVRGEGGVADDLVNIYFTPTPGVAPPDGTVFTMVNNAAYTITVRATGNIRLNGAATVAVGTNQSAQFVSDSGRMLLVAGP